MARVQIDLPEIFLFETRLDIRVSDINYGQHLANDAMLRLAQEARVRFLHAFGYSEKNVGGRGIIMADAAICYKAEVFYPTILCWKLGITDISRSCVDLVYQVCDDKTGQEVARLKTAIVFFDYNKRKVSAVPARFLDHVYSHSRGEDKLSCAATE